MKAWCNYAGIAFRLAEFLTLSDQTIVARILLSLSLRQQNTTIVRALSAEGKAA
jgi:hypothetical protein